MLRQLIHKAEQAFIGAHADAAHHLGIERHAQWLPVVLLKRELDLLASAAHHQIDLLVGRQRLIVDEIQHPLSVDREHLVSGQDAQLLRDAAFLHCDDPLCHEFISSGCQRSRDVRKRPAAHRHEVTPVCRAHRKPSHLPFIIPDFPFGFNHPCAANALCRRHFTLRAGEFCVIFPLCAGTGSVFQ